MNTTNIKQHSEATTFKVTLTTTQENRFIALPSVSFGLLASKVGTTFAISSAQLRITYHDEEGDTISVSSDDELACAISLVPSGRPLRLFVSEQEPLTHDSSAADVQPAGSDSTLQPEQETAGQEQATDDSSAADIPPTISNSEQEQAPKDPKVEVEEAEADETKLLGALKQTLEQEGITVCDRKCHRVLNKFAGDVDKAATAICSWHEKHAARRERRQHDPIKAQQREARMAARQLRKQQRSTKPDSDCGEAQRKEKMKMKRAEQELVVDSLVAYMAEMGLGEIVCRRKCMGALRKCHGDVDQAKATLAHWYTNHHERADRKGAKNRTSAEIPDEHKPLLAQLEAKGLGGDERTKKRNACLLRRFDGDAVQVEALLAARKAKCEARAQRKTRCARRAETKANECTAA